MLGLPPEQVRVTAMMVGGGFGGKEDMSVQHHAALACYLLKRPVKVRFSRADSLQIHPKRHAMEMEFTVADGVDISKLAEGQTLHLQVMQEGEEYRITTIHQEKAPTSGHALEQAKDEMEGMGHSQHNMGAKP